MKDPAQEAACQDARNRADKATKEAAAVKDKAKTKVVKMETTIKE